MDTKRPAHAGFLGAFAHQHVPRRGADAFSNPVDDPRSQNAAPGRSGEKRKLVEKACCVTNKRDRFFMLVAVAYVPAPYFEETGKALRDSLDNAHQRRRPAQNRGKIDGNERVDHFRAHVGKKADEAQQNHVTQIISSKRTVLRKLYLLYPYKRPPAIYIFVRMSRAYCVDKYCFI
ncbi:hypothetical protein SDC9_107487 [bioreactor metagenome]|uniref:Uncharacterized protein n=1 Tax=bioreactor metagenome TaxID=1076179 RepID=A0A645B5C8_9ZZZZ